MEPTTEASRLDLLAQELQRLRVRAGSPSYETIARLVGEQRSEAALDGRSPGRPGKTTVYDVFRFGRRRVDVALALEIVRALGGDDTELAAWRERYEAALGAADVIAVPRPRVAEVTSVETVPARAATQAAEAAATGSRSAWSVVVVLLVALGLNMVCGRLAAATGLPLYLDMIGTAVAAIVLGPWWGALLGALTNVTEVVPLNLDVTAPHWGGLPFALVNVAGALVWGYGVRRFAYGRTLPRFFLLNLMVAVVCTLVAVPIIVAVGPGMRVLSIVQITATLNAAYHDAVGALFSSNLLTSLADKLISGFVALTTIEMLPRAWREQNRDLTLNGAVVHNRAASPAFRTSLWRLSLPS